MDYGSTPGYMSGQRGPLPGAWALDGEEVPGGAVALHQFFRDHPKIALAFSGGTDSALVLYVAKKAGCDIRPYFVSSQFQPQFERDDGHRLCNQLGVALNIVPLDILEDEAVASNPPNRCYYCKKRIFEAIVTAAAQEGYAFVIDGTNASDDADKRPGMRALAELKIRSPLAECHITKEQVRELSHRYGLFTWDKPAYACLATRIPAGQGITAQLLSRVDRGEEVLRTLGFTNFRVRVMGHAAKLQVPEDQMAAVLAQRETITQALLPEFAAVLLDLMPR